jgi:TonB family protein
MSTAVAIETWKDQVIDGKFSLLQRLGGSDRSDVFLTELPGETAQKAVVKLIPADRPNAEKTISRWEAIVKLSHPHLVRIFHVGRCNINSIALLYVVTEYADEDLSQVLPSRPLTPDETGDLLRGLVDVLAFVHEQGFVHSHLRPSNIMAVKDHLKISSDTMQRAGERHDDSRALGPYDAPEVASGELSPATDVWSLGITLVTALTQKPPSWDRSANREPVIAESVPEPFRQIVEGCLRLDPNQRLTLGQIQARLNPAPVSVTPKSRTGLLIAAQVALIGLLAIFWLVGHRGPTKAPKVSPKLENNVSSTPQPPVPAVPMHTGTVPGAVAEKIMPNVSQSARNTIQGKIKVTVRLVVDDEGQVSEATLERAGPSKYFARQALAAARAWKFQPPEVDGKPVPSKWTIHFRFGRTGTEATASETSR